MWVNLQLLFPVTNLKIDEKARLYALFLFLLNRLNFIYFYLNNINLYNNKCKLTRMRVNYQFINVKLYIHQKD